MNLIDWLLIDVESAELMVLKGAKEALKKTKRVIVEVDYANKDDVFAILDSARFLLVESGSLDPVNQYHYFVNTDLLN